ncbi:AAA family ATPase [Endozoicomonas sp. 4G]|uniref:AAA family ATPase n=1 Tax=Endozoicomonas sp. 4G TaxID=2872754 RepID=UPI002078C60D|nr:AAA family ATPase [Endozoicomonas sp. 4G]
MNYRVVFTGGPGSGKTTIISLLSCLGYQTAPEVGRKVIQSQVNSQGSALPWIDKVAFRDEMVFEEISNYKNYGNSVLTFFDRSIIDSYGYSKLEKIQISDILLKKCHELAYNRNVFIFPPWESIYENDTDRKQSFNEAVATYNEMVKAYKQFGYRLIEAPKVSVAERVEFILHKIGSG